jgi:membrane fusion protein (multidrug efflux system)
VKIILEPGQALTERLRVGMSVEASVNTHAAAQPREVAQQ